MSDTVNSINLEEKCRRLENQIKTLKDVSTIRKELLELREKESKDFISRLKTFEEVIGFEKESRIKLTEKLNETENSYKELNIKYEETQKLLNEAEVQNKSHILNLESELEESKTLVQNKIDEITELEKQMNNANENVLTLSQQLSTNNERHATEIQDYKDRISELENRLDKAQSQVNSILVENAELKKYLSETSNVKLDLEESLEELPSNEVAIKNLQEELEGVKAKNKGLLYQMSLLNSLFNETEGTPINFDRIRAIGNIVRESQSIPPSEEGNENENIATIDEEDRKSKLDGIHNRMEVLLTEKALSDVHGIIDQLDAQNHESIPGEESCYKSIDTTGGPKLVLSVSRTFLKLKDLILEKKSLQKQIDGLKELNGKLESKVDKQQRRLYFVALELNKTWSLVSKLKAQHSQLHNTRSSQRYDLQEKRKLLERLKRDLHLSREKWIKVRQKNSESQKEWDIIHDEFQQRKLEREKNRGLEYSDSRESAFSEDFSSTTTTTTTGEGEADGDRDAGAGPSGTSSPNLPVKRKSSKIDVLAICEDDSLDGFVADIANEMDTIEQAVDENEGSDEDVDDIVGEVDGSASSWAELVNKRAQRLRILEEQCRLLYSKLQASTARNSELASKLADLHNHYGSTSIATTSEEENENSYSEYDHDEVNVEPSSLAQLQVVQQVEEDENVNSSETERLGLEQMPETQGTKSEEQRHEAPGPSTSSRILNLTTSDNDEEITKNSIREQQLLAELKRTIDAVVEDNDDENSMTLTKVTESSQHDGVVSDMVEELNDNNNTTEPAGGTLCSKLFLFNGSNTIIGGDGDDTSERSSPDLNGLSRLIIQQLPKRLDVLKNENRALRAEIRETQSSSSAQTKEIMELRVELELKQKLIEELTSKIHIATESYETINREHGRMAEYFKIKMQEREIQQQRKIAKARNAKNCKSCNKKFTIFKRKFHCINCGHAYCNDCLSTPQHGEGPSQVVGSGELGSGSSSCTSDDDVSAGKNYKSQKKQRLCQPCIERKQRLDNAIALAVKSTSSTNITTATGPMTFK